MAYDVPEFVTKDGGLLPFGQVLIDDDCTSAQDALPKSVDVWRQRGKNHNAVQFLCDSIWV